jgi:hypothetical protein
MFCASRLQIGRHDFETFGRSPHKQHLSSGPCQNALCLLRNF